jgi:cytochrome c-type biogenesis protein
MTSPATLVREGTTRGRTALAAAVTVAVLGLAVIAGLTSPTTGGAPVIFVDRLSSAISDLSAHAGEVWWVYAFALGAVAAFNPCGFALVPAYLGLYLRGDVQASLGARLRRSIVVAAVVGAMFTLLFGAVGAVFSIGSSLIVRSLPWVGLGVGIVLIGVGGWILSGRPFAPTLPQRMASRVGAGAGRSGLRGYAAFGLAYGAASLGCTFPLFFSVVGTATAVGGPGTAVIAFLLYGAGMAATLGALTIAAGVVSFGILGRARRFGHALSAFGAVLLFLSGAYVVYYWLTAGRLLLG